MVSSGVASLDQLLGDGYPDRSTILVVGPPGIGKQALGYWFAHSGLVQGDISLYVTRFAVHEVLQDVRGFGIDPRQMGPIWLASDSRESRYDANDLASIGSNILEILKKNAGRRVRITIDTLSSLLILNSPETVYIFDGVVELRMYEDRLRLLPLLRIAKMRGLTPSHGYFHISFSKTGIEVSVYVKELGIRGWLRGPK